MEVVTKVACGSVIAGGSGAAGAYGVHRWSTFQESQQSEVQAPTEQRETTANSDSQPGKTVVAEQSGDQGKSTTAEGGPAAGAIQNPNPALEAAGGQRQDEGERGGSGAGTPNTEESSGAQLSTESNNNPTDGNDAEGTPPATKGDQGTTGEADSRTVNPKQSIEAPQAGQEKGSDQEGSQDSGLGVTSSEGNGAQPPNTQDTVGVPGA